MQRFVDIAADSILENLSSRKDYMDIMIDLDTTSEEWFRIEILKSVSGIEGLIISSTNQQLSDGKSRPDFTFNLGGMDSNVELKVLPVIKNYLDIWGRFTSSTHNKK